MNLMKMIIVMFLHFVIDLALLCRLNTKDLLKEVLSDPLQEGFSVESLLMPATAPGVTFSSAPTSLALAPTGRVFLMQA